MEGAQADLELGQGHQAPERYAFAPPRPFRDRAQGAEAVDLVVRAIFDAPSRLRERLRHCHVPPPTMDNSGAKLRPWPRFALTHIKSGWRLVGRGKHGRGWDGCDTNGPR